jgi:hypothetical protein
VIVPVGGLQNVPTSIALLHNQLKVSVMVDGSQSGLQRIHNMVDRGLLDASKLLALTDLTHTKAADIEDLFGEAFYLRLLKKSGTVTLTKAKLGKSERIVKRVEEALVTASTTTAPPATSWSAPRCWRTSRRHPRPLGATHPGA